MLVYRRVLATVCQLESRHFEWPSIIEKKRAIMGHPRRRPQIARCWFITSLSRIYSNNAGKHLDLPALVGGHLRMC